MYKLLFIDDDDIFLYLTHQSLKDLSFIDDIESVRDANQAEVYLEECANGLRKFPDLIFIDLKLPDINGIDLASRLYEKYGGKFSETRMFILTSSTSEKEKEKALEIPIVDEVIRKPLKKDFLNNLLLAKS